MQAHRVRVDPQGQPRLLLVDAARKTQQRRQVVLVQCGVGVAAALQ